MPFIKKTSPPTSLNSFPETPVDFPVPEVDAKKGIANMEKWGNQTAEWWLALKQVMDDRHLTLVNALNDAAGQIKQMQDTLKANGITVNLTGSVDPTTNQTQSPVPK